MVVVGGVRRRREQPLGKTGIFFLHNGMMTKDDVSKIFMVHICGSERGEACMFLAVF